MSFAGKTHTPEAREKMAAANRGKPKSAEHRRKLGEKMRGRKITDEHREAISRGLLGHPYSEETRRKVSEKMRGRNRTDQPTYAGMHTRLRQVLPRVCAMADGTCRGRLEVAFRHDTPSAFRWVEPNSDRPFSVRVEDYVRLCGSHHARYDEKGHR